MLIFLLFVGFECSILLLNQQYPQVTPNRPFAQKASKLLQFCCWWSFHGPELQWRGWQGPWRGGGRQEGRWWRRRRWAAASSRPPPCPRKRSLWSRWRWGGRRRRWSSVRTSTWCPPVWRFKVWRRTSRLKPLKYIGRVSKVPHLDKSPLVWANLAYPPLWPERRKLWQNSDPGWLSPGAGRGCIGAGEAGKASQQVHDGEKVEEKCRPTTPTWRKGKDQLGRCWSSNL